MSLDKAILHGKEKRKQYRKSGRIDASCRPHGGCPWCESNRKHSTLVRQAKADATREEEVREDPDEFDEQGFENWFFGGWGEWSQTTHARNKEG